MAAQAVNATPARWLGPLAAASTGVLVGAAIVATRFVIDQTQPASLALLRYCIGFMFLLPPLLWSGWVKFECRDLWPIALLGITQFGILIALLNFALQTISSARAALLFSSFPLMTLMIAAALGRERITWFKSLGVLLTIVGVGLALGVTSRQPGAGVWMGELAALASALCGAVCSVLYRPYLRKYPTLPVSAVAMLASIAFLAILAISEGFFQAPPQFTWGGWLAVLFIGLSSGIGYYLWLWALNHMSATRVTVFLALSPATATTLGVVWLGEPATIPFLLGLCCIAAGLWCAYRR